MTLIDSHSHLFLDEFSEDLPQVIERARLAGVTHIFMPNIDSTTIAPMLNVCEKYKGYCFPMIGLHPTSVTADYTSELAIVKQHLESSNSFVAIGEIGIDLYWDKTYLNEQLHVFRQQIEWALEYHLPIVIHTREAFEYVCQVLEPYRNTSLKGIFHSFTGTADEAAQLMTFDNFFFGINGVVTFKKSTLPDALRTIPLDRLVLETDSPYLAPVPNRGKRNEPAYLRQVVARLAEIYGRREEEIAELTTANSRDVFGC